MLFPASNIDIGGFLFGGSAQALKAAELQALKTTIDNESETQKTENDEQSEPKNNEPSDQSDLAKVDNVEGEHSQDIQTESKKMDIEHDESELVKSDNNVNLIDNKDETETSQLIESLEPNSEKVDTSITEDDFEILNKSDADVKSSSRDKSENQLTQKDEQIENDKYQISEIIDKEATAEEPTTKDKRRSRRGADKDIVTEAKLEPSFSSRRSLRMSAAKIDKEELKSPETKFIRKSFEHDESQVLANNASDGQQKSNRRSRRVIGKEDTEDILQNLGTPNSSRRSQRTSVKITEGEPKTPAKQRKRSTKIDAELIDPNEDLSSNPVKRGKRSVKYSTENGDSKEHEAKTPVIKGKRSSRVATEPRHKKISKDALNNTVATDDPFSFETQGDIHPQPLFSVSKGGFSNIKFTLSPRTDRKGPSKYAKTEAAAALKRKSFINEDVELEPVKPFSITEMSTTTHNAKAALKSFTPKLESRKGRTPKKDSTVKVNPKSTQRTARQRSSSPLLPKKEVQTITAPIVSKEEQKDLDFCHEPFPTGMRVYALWGKELYPAIIVDRDGLGRYKVFFVEDSLHRDIPPTGIICLSWLKEGTELSTTAFDEDDGIESSVKIVKLPNSINLDEWDKAEFEVINTEGISKILTWKKIYITMAQQKQIGINKNTALTIGEDNVVSTRSRRSRLSAVSLPLEPIVKTPRKKRGFESSKPDSTPEKTPAKRGRKSKEVVQEVSGTDEIFAGKQFMLTSSARRGHLSEFNKREFKSMIESRGGFVAEDINQFDNSSDTFLVADTYYRTHKYLYALAADIPCVHFNWIKKCVDQNEFISHHAFLLPAGISIIADKEYACQPLKGKLLQNKTVFVYSSTPSATDPAVTPFADIWRPLLVTLGANVITTVSTEPHDINKFIDENEYDYMLTDRSCEAIVIEHSNTIDRPVVSSNWVIHGIVTGEWLPVETHESFLPTN